jgi:hypothetical protein
VKGTCPSVTFTLKGYSVSTTASTAYTRGTCKDLKNDKDVSLRGTLTGASTVTANSIEVKK